MTASVVDSGCRLPAQSSPLWITELYPQDALSLRRSMRDGHTVERLSDLAGHHKEDHDT
jgi:hypothetical protein